jgi:GDP-L-fucose synthase
MRNILVTGATGFLGGHLIEALEKEGFVIHISNTQVANLNNLNNLDIYDQINFDYIFHLAAVTKAGDYCLRHPGDQWLANQIINTNILKYWKERQPKAKMICMGTSCSYAPDIPMKEENYLIGTPEKSLYTYAMTKRMLLDGLKALEQQYGLEWLYFIPSTLYGPNFEEEDSHFIFDLIKKIYNGATKGTAVELWGDGYQKRELVFVEDAVEMIINLLDQKNEIFNLGSSKDYTIREFAGIISKLIGYEEEIYYDTSKYVGVREKKVIMSKVEKLGVGVMRTPLYAGLKETVDYYIKRFGAGDY